MSHVPVITETRVLPGHAPQAPFRVSAHGTVSPCKQVTTRSCFSSTNFQYKTGHALQVNPPACETKLQVTSPRSVETRLF